MSATSPAWAFLFTGKVYATGIVNGIPVDVIEAFVYAVHSIDAAMQCPAEWLSPEPNVVADPETGSLSIVNWEVAPDFPIQIIIGPKEAAS